MAFQKSKSLKYLFSAFFWLSTALVFAQAGRIQFTQSVQDFQKIYEKAGPVTYTFIFTNEGEHPINITSATASCGCTTPEFTKGTVKPGETGTVKVEYNPLGRPGPFVKTITVQNTGIPSTVVLTIKGEVIAGESPTDERPAEFVQYFPYNEKVITMDEPGFKSFIDRAFQIAQKTGRITFSIESSSSTVPTKKFKSNLLLTKKRSADAKQRIIKAMKLGGFDEGLIFFLEDKNLIQGPEYKKDALENVKEYEMFQYVKVLAQ